jgi:hypothetical protein
MICFSECGESNLDQLAIWLKPGYCDRAGSRALVRSNIDTSDTEVT